MGEVTTTQLFHLHVGAEKRGPYTLTQLRSMWLAGTITADAFISEGDAAALPISSIQDLLEPAPSSSLLQPSDSALILPRPRGQLVKQQVPFSRTLSD